MVALVHRWMLGCYVCLQLVAVISSELAVRTRDVGQAGWFLITLVGLGLPLSCDEIHFYDTTRRNVLTFFNYSKFCGGIKQGIGCVGGWWWWW